MSRQDQCSKDCELLVRKIVDVRQLYIKLCKGCSMPSHGGFNEVHLEWHWHCKRAASERALGLGVSCARGPIPFRVAANQITHTRRHRRRTVKGRPSPPTVSFRERQFPGPINYVNRSSLEGTVFCSLLPTNPAPFQSPFSGAVIKRVDQGRTDERPWKD